MFVQCPKCKGSGFQQAAPATVVRPSDGKTVTYFPNTPCPICNGRGEVDVLAVN